MPSEVIEQSIEALFDLYRGHPLRLMREIGIQTRLASLIQTGLAQPFSRAQIVNGHAIHDTEDTVERVQMEIRVEVPGHSGREASDLVVLRHSENEAVALTLYPNGHLDIVAKISARDVAAVIEIKAACSADRQERHQFRLDVGKLLSLASRIRLHGGIVPQMHFVLVDKSLSVGEHDRSRMQPRREWFTELTTEVDTWTDLGQERFWTNSPRIQVGSTEPAHTAFVHVWTLKQEEDGSAGDCVHQYATAA